MSEAAATSITSEEADSHHGENTNTGIPNKKLAMWAFLASDCMFFGTLISTHLIYRRVNPDIVIDGSFVPVTQIFDIELTGASTFILLMSSLTMALTVSAMHKHNLKAARTLFWPRSSLEASSSDVRSTSFITSSTMKRTRSH